MNNLNNINNINKTSTSIKSGSLLGWQAGVSGKKKYIEGVVISDKMAKTVVVAVSTLKAHPKYLKKYLVTRKYKAHDPEKKFKVGDKVKIKQGKPKSKEKKWEVIYEIKN